MAGCEIQTIQCRCLMWVGDLEIAYYIYKNIYRFFCFKQYADFQITNPCNPPPYLHLG